MGPGPEWLPVALGQTQVWGLKGPSEGDCKDGLSSTCWLSCLFFLRYFVWNCLQEGGSQKGGTQLPFPLGV